VFPLRLLRIALSAEGLRRRHHFRRILARAVVGGVALALFLGGLVFAHVAAWLALSEVMATRYVALVFAAADLLLALILALIAARSAPGRVEREALEVRRRALDEAADSLTVSALLIRLIDQLTRPRPKQGPSE
jgi:signal transduction histidine kinase